jgi:hypothetical protein
MMTEAELVRVADTLATTPDYSEKIAAVYGLEVIDEPQKLLGHRHDSHKQLHISNKCTATIVRQVLLQLQDKNKQIDELKKQLAEAQTSKLTLFQQLFKRHNNG